MVGGGHRCGFIRVCGGAVMAAFQAFEEQRQPNYAFEADAVRRRTVSCRVCAPRGSTRRWAYK